MNICKTKYDFIFCLVILGALTVAAWGSFSIVNSAKNRLPSAQDTYLIAVYILQNIDNLAAGEEINIPRKIASADLTQSLLHHPDKIFVLQKIAEDLAEYGESEPKARLFEAYARLGLGDKYAAVNLLERYVIENKYNTKHYSLLCANLLSLRENSSLLLICSEWRERDPSCLADRARYRWSGLYNLQRYDDARQYALDERACLGWKAEVYAAKALLAMGNADEAEVLLEKALYSYSTETNQIKSMWEQLKKKQEM